MRILQVSARDGGGGGEKVAYDLHCTYRARGYPAWFVVGHKRSDDPDVVTITDHVGNTWQRLCFTIGDFFAPLEGRVRGVGRVQHWLRLIGEPKKSLEILRGHENFEFPGSWRILDLLPEKPDIIHCHTLHGNYFDLRVLPWLSQQVPVILTLHDAWLLSGHCAHSFDCERWETGCGQCPDLTIYPAIKHDATAYNWRRKRDIFNRSRLYITAPSRWLVDKAKKSMLKGVQYRVIPHGVDLTIFKPGNRDEARHALQLPLKARIILLVAHNPFKDLTTMEAALGLINLDTNDELVFLCLGRNSMERTLGQGIIRYLEYESDLQRMSWYYQAADLYIHAAHGDTFPRTITEVMACGIPVVATAVGGIPEQVTDGVTGFLVPPYNAERLSNATKLLLTNEDLHRKMSESAAIHAMKRFCMDRQVIDFLTWYEEVLEDWSRKDNNALSIS
jgi:glycosyltransferase involved in cell wall biosynthesis